MTKAELTKIDTLPSRHRCGEAQPTLATEDNRSVAGCCGMVEICAERNKIEFARI